MKKEIVIICLFLIMAISHFVLVTRMYDENYVLVLENIDLRYQIVQSEEQPCGIQIQFRNDYQEFDLYEVN
jgi:hypothetical protein